MRLVIEMFLWKWKSHENRKYSHFLHFVVSTQTYIFFCPEKINLYSKVFDKNFRKKYTLAENPKSGRNPSKSSWEKSYDFLNLGPAFDRGRVFENLPPTSGLRLLRPRSSNKLKRWFLLKKQGFRATMFQPRTSCPHEGIVSSLNMFSV